MKTIYKYPVPVDDWVEVKMSKGAQVLCVQMQNGTPCVWALVDPTKEIEERYFLWRGTGHSMPPNHGKYIGTVQAHGGALILHLFEKY